MRDGKDSDAKFIEDFAARRARMDEDRPRHERRSNPVAVVLLAAALVAVLATVLEMLT